MAAINQADRLRKLLDKKLNPTDKSLLPLLEFEARKDHVIVRMPHGVISLESLWGKICSIATESSISISQAGTYATADELDDVLGNIEWLWPNWIPLGFITLLVGEPGIGKTMVAVDFARMLTKGIEFPESKGSSCSCREQNVVWIDAEAGHQILRERLISFGVNRARVYLPVIDGDLLSQPDFTNEDHRRVVENLIAAKQPRMLVLDSLGGSNRRGENKVEEVRPLLEYLAKLAQCENLSVLILHHLNKGSPDNVGIDLNQDRIRGSTAIPAFSRSIIGASAGIKEHEIKLAVIKSNLARLSKPLRVESLANEKGLVTQLNYSPYTPPAPKKTKKESCADWIMEQLGSRCGDPYPLKDLIDLGIANGFAHSTIYSAKEQLGDRITVTGTGRQAFWQSTEELANDSASISSILAASGGRYGFTKSIEFTGLRA